MPDIQYDETPVTTHWSLFILFSSAALLVFKPHVRLSSDTHQIKKVRLKSNNLTYFGQVKNLIKPSDNQEQRKSKVTNDEIMQVGRWDNFVANGFCRTSPYGKICPGDANYLKVKYRYKSIGQMQKNFGWKPWHLQNYSGSWVAGHSNVKLKTIPVPVLPIVWFFCI